MGGISILQILVIVLVVLLNILPWVLALTSNKVRGMEKFLWFLSSFIASWLGYLVFYFVVVKNKRTNSSLGYEPVRDENGRIIQ